MPQTIESPSSSPTSTQQLSEDELMQFTIEKSRFGLYTSVTPSGVRMVTGMTEDACRWVTINIHIPVMMGTYDGYTSEGRRAVVDGKL